MSRVLLIAATAGYQTRIFESAIRDLGHDLLLATDRCHMLEDPWGDQAIAVRFDHPESAADHLAGLGADAVVAVGDAPTGIAALTAAKLSLPYHSPPAVALCRDKYAARERFRLSGLNVPDYFRAPTTIEPQEAARSAQYPCVLKPLCLSGSRGVIRANDEIEFVEAFDRIRRMGSVVGDFLQVECFIPGREFALEGIVTGGLLQTLAIFDKPDPLDGPFFEETIYVTPSCEGSAIQQELIRTTQLAIRSLGLEHGPIHAEMRLNQQGVWMLEIAARPIGGLCARSLRFDRDTPLEHLIIRHALGEDVSMRQREDCASAVMMIPIPESGIYSGVTGVAEAGAVNGVEDVVITAKEGQHLLRLPEGSSYLGFIFARTPTAEGAQRAVRDAHALLRFQINRTLPVFRR